MQPIRPYRRRLVVGTALFLLAVLLLAIFAPKWFLGRSHKSEYDADLSMGDVSWGIKGNRIVLVSAPSDLNWTRILFRSNTEGVIGTLLPVGENATLRATQSFFPRFHGPLAPGQVIVLCSDHVRPTTVDLAYIPESDNYVGVGYTFEKLPTCNTPG